MAEQFKHPLARSACLRPAVSLDGAERQNLIIVTTLQLDPKRDGYKREFVEKLSRAAKNHLSHVPNAQGFVLINRPRDWRA